MKTKILIVEDQFVEANNLRIILEKSGYHVTAIAYSVMDALEEIEKEVPDMVLLDIFLQGELTGIDLAVKLRMWKIAFVFISANSDKKILDAAKATRPFGFLVKPFREKDVLVMLDIALYAATESSKLNASTNHLLKHSTSFPNKIIASSAAMLEVMDNARLVAKSDTSVLITGESGTGKEILAKCIHEFSARSGKNLVIVNCGALPANLVESELFGHEKGSFTGATDKRVGKFEQADGGTIFLDEVGELPLETQSKFLRVLQEREIEPIGGKSKRVDVRIIAATNRDLEQDVADGRFRLDLYYRLSVFPLMIPPLRERREEISVLAKHFVDVYAKKENKVVVDFTDDVLRSMMNHPWPGNVRELENVVARAVLLAKGSRITSVQLSTKNPAFRNAIADSGIKTIVENERDHIISALVRANWKIFGAGGAAELLGINPSTLNSRIKKLGISKSSATAKGK